MLSRWRMLWAGSLAALMAHPALGHEAGDTHEWTFAIHGGAGTMAKESMTGEQRAEYEAAMQAALDLGGRILSRGGSAMDAVKAAVVLLEDDPKFNAGRGAVYTWDGTNELDASIMDGSDRSAGAVTGVSSIRNPILLADAVRRDGRHVFLSGDGAETFATEKGFGMVEPGYFETEGRKKALERMKESRVGALDVDYKFGTVGAVALDSHGNVAAATSTGGMTGKRWGRIGDSPMIGAGTYADNRSCAVSATGSGEYFIRIGVAQEICTRLRMAGQIALDEFASGQNGMDAPDTTTKVGLTATIVQGISDAVMAEVEELGGSGGVIVLTPEGEAIFSFNTQGMYRGRANSEGLNEVAIFAPEE